MTRATRATRRYRATVVGFGAMGLRHARAFAAASDRFEVVGGYDVRPDVAMPPGVLRLRCEEEAIALGEVLVVATSTEAHGGVVARALAAGRHVLVEKPLCATAAEAGALARCSARGPGSLFVGHSERFNPVVRALERLLRGEPLVAIDLLRAGPCRPTDGGVLVNLGVHDFDLAAYLGGGPLSLRSAVGPSPAHTGACGGPPDGGGEDLAHVLFTTAGGAAGHLCADRTAKAKSRALAIVTPRWLYEGDLLTHRLVRTARASGARTDVPLPLGEPLVAQALALADALDGAARTGAASTGARGASDIATGADGAYAVALAERASEMLSPGPFESRAREKLVVAKAPLLPRE